MRRRKKCWSCRYFGPVTGTVGTCDYLLITGHARSLICPAGERCTVYSRLRGRRPEPIPQEVPECDEVPVCMPWECEDDGA